MTSSRTAAAVTGVEDVGVDTDAVVTSRRTRPNISVVGISAIFVGEVRSRCLSRERVRLLVLDLGDLRLDLSRDLDLERDLRRSRDLDLLLPRDLERRDLELDDLRSSLFLPSSPPPSTLLLSSLLLLACDALVVASFTGSSTVSPIGRHLDAAEATGLLPSDEVVVSVLFCFSSTSVVFSAFLLTSSDFASSSFARSERDLFRSRDRERVRRRFLSLEVERRPRRRSRERDLDLERRLRRE